jgi:hypothetical protein
MLDEVDRHVAAGEVALANAAVDPVMGRPAFQQQLYSGVKTQTLWPRAARALGSDMRTSPRPPVLENGATSAEAKTMVNGRAAAVAGMKFPFGQVEPA